MTGPSSPARVEPAAIPWADRDDPPSPSARAAVATRSARDLEILRSLAERIPDGDASAHNNLGVVYYGKSLYAEAAEQLERALELDPSMQVAERNLQIVYFATGHYDELVSSLRARLALDPADHEARRRLARTYLFGGDPATAIDEWRKLLKAFPRDARLYQQIARAEHKRGDLDAALVALRNAGAIAPRDARVQLQLGEVLYHRGMHTDARGPLERAVALDDTLAEAHHLLSFVYGELGDAENAGRAAERAAELNPSYIKTEAGLSLDGHSVARYEELVGDRSPRPRVAEGGALAHFSLGVAFRQKGLYDEALREFRLAAEHGEDPFLVHQARAEMVLLRGGGEEAAELYAQLIEQEPASPKLCNELGVAHHQLGRLADAERAYRQALDIDPAYALAWNNLGVVRHHRGDDAGAEAALRSGLERARPLAGLWRNLGLMLERVGREAEAEDAYRRALETDPGAAAAWTGLGTLLLGKARSEEARLALARAVEADPQLAEARYHHAFALSATGDYAAALRETRIALELNPYIPSPRFQLLIDLQFEEAGVFAPELDPPHRLPPHAAGAAGTAGTGAWGFDFEPGVLDAVLRDPSAALGDGISAPRDVGRPSSPAAIEWLASARAALENGEPARATADVQRAAALGANPVEAMLLQGEVYLSSGATGEAEERFREALAAIDSVAGRANSLSPRGGEGRGEGDGGPAGFDVIDARRRALLGASRSLLELERHEAAITAAEQLCETTPGDIRAVLALGEALVRASEFERAAAVLEQARERAPRDLEVLTRLGQAYMAAGRLQAAEATLRDALESNASAPAAHAALGQLLMKRRRMEEARRAFGAALEAIPSYGAAAIGLAELESSEGRTREAIHVLADLLTVDPYHLPALVRLGDLLSSAGRDREAGMAYRRVLRLDPASAAALAGLERLAPIPRPPHSNPLARTAERGRSRTADPGRNGGA